MSDQINHPQHYGGDTIYEVIKVMEAWLTPEEFIGAMKFNIHKYNARARKKGSEDEDYKKAQFYQNYLVEYMQRLALDEVCEERINRIIAERGTRHAQDS